VNYLYSLNLPIVGNIHCGNVFSKNDDFLLGGYENLFLGYKTGSFKGISEQGLLSHMDLIMFGEPIQTLPTAMKQI